MKDVEPEGFGLYGDKEQGLGGAMWKGTPRELVERLLPALNLPVPSPTLNNLADRFLLTAAEPPAGKPGEGQSLIALRALALVALGDMENAWKLVMAAKPDLVDDVTLRNIAEAGLVGANSSEVCGRLPDIMKTHSGPDWQKLLLVCQLNAKDMKAAQVTLDLLHQQNVSDDIYFAIVEHNIIEGKKELPRQLTPLRPLTLALLKLLDMPPRGEIFMHPEPSLIPALLLLKSRDENARLALAERAGDRAVINARELEEVYASITFKPEQVTAALSSTETGPRLHALLYQAALQSKTAVGRLPFVMKFLQNASAVTQNGVGAQVMVDLIGDLAPSDETNQASGALVHIYTIANKPDAALLWMKVARKAQVGLPGVGAEVKSIWPLSVFAGLEAPDAYAPDLDAWINDTLKLADPKDDNADKRDLVSSILLLLEADGFAVTPEQWAKVINPPTLQKHILPSAVLLERLYDAGKAQRRGETVLYGLLLNGTSTNEAPFLATVDFVRALRESGLTGDAGMLARETAALLLTVPRSTP